MELLAGDRCRLVVVALETGGRWSSEAIQFVESLASSRAREEQPTLVRPLPGMEKTSIPRTQLVARSCWSGRRDS